MAALTLHPMKEIRVIVSGEHRPFVTELLDKVEATGYTIIGNISGKGHHGLREAHFMFSEQESLVMIMGGGAGGKGGTAAGRAPAAVRATFGCHVRLRCRRQPARIFRQEEPQVLTGRPGTRGW
jgi:hypothetical protein